MADLHRLKTVPLGKITSWETKRASTLMPIPMPGGNTAETEAPDTLGIIGYTNLSGKWTGKFNDIQMYIALINNIADGNQDQGVIFQSNFINFITNEGAAVAGRVGINTTVTPNHLVVAGERFLALGVQNGDYVKNLTTGVVAEVDTVTNEVIKLKPVGSSGSVDLFTAVGEAYAVTVRMNAKIMSFDFRWELPGLSVCNYSLSLLQVK